MAEKINLLKEIEAEIFEYGDEEWIDAWFTYGVPDEATEEDYEFIAEDEDLYADCINLYNNFRRETR